MLEDDQYIIDEVIKGNIECFTKIVMKYEQYAYKCAIILLKDHHYAKDAVNEAFMHAYRSIKTFKNENFKSYFLKIVYNCCYEILRKNKRLILKEVEKEEEGYNYTEFEFEKLDDSKAIIKALQSLALEDKTIIMLKYYYDYDYNQIASFLKIKAATVGSRLFRAKEKLKKALKDGGDFFE